MTTKNFVNDAELESAVRDILIEICAIMFRYGYQDVPVPPMLMLLGVPEEKAQNHQGEFFTYDADFQDMWEKRQKAKQTKVELTSKTLH